MSRSELKAEGVRLVRGIAFSLVLFALLFTGFLIAGRLLSWLTPTRSYFETSEIRPLITAEGQPLLFRTTREVRRSGNLTASAWLYCQSESGWERLWRHTSTSAAFPEQPASTVWRFGDDEAPFIPQQPYPECFLLLRSCMSVSAFLEKCETVQSPSFEIRGKP